MKAIIRNIYVDVRCCAVFLTTTLLLLLGTQNVVGQTDTIRYVKMNGSYTNDGKSWETAKNNLQEAINDLHDYLKDNNLKSGCIYVAAGTYKPTESTEQGGDGILYTSFKLYDGISLYGGFDKDTPEDSADFRLMDDGETTYKNAKGKKWQFQNKTILSGDHSNKPDDTEYLTFNPTKNQFDASYPGSSYHVVWFATNGFIDGTKRANKLETPSVVDGFTIRGGNASNKTTTTREHNSYGGGAYMVDGAVVRNCIITQNSAVRCGGGVYLDGGGTVEQCMIERNQSEGIGIVDGYGGGACIDYDGCLRQCVVRNNAARIGGGVAISHEDGYPTSYKDVDRYHPSLTGCLVVTNSSTTEAGGVVMIKGGTINHATIARNHCSGLGVVMAGRRYGRSAGLYIEEYGKVFNSVMGGGTVANDSVQYAAYVSETNAAEDQPHLYYSAISRYDYTDWTGTVKNNITAIESLNSDNRPGLYARFKKVPPLTKGGVAGVISTIDANLQDWQPLGASALKSKGVQLSDYGGTDRAQVTQAAITEDYTGSTFSPRTTLGALNAEDDIVTTAVIASQEPGEDDEITTLFVDPNRESWSPGNLKEVGNSWAAPLVNINDALNYIRDKNLTDDGREPVQVLVKQGETVNSGDYFIKHLRSSNIMMVDNVRVYGGYSSELKTTDVKSIHRNPVLYPTRITANIAGDDYKNNTCHVVAFNNVSNAILDGFQLYYANATPNDVFPNPANTNGGGVIVNNEQAKTQVAMAGNQLRNCVIANCTASQGAGIYIKAATTKVAIDVTNCIIHNNKATIAENPAAIAVIGKDATATFDHCTVRGNVGYGLLVDNAATVTFNNSVIHANAKTELADINQMTEDDEKTIQCIEVVNGGTLTGSYNKLDKDAATHELKETAADLTYNTSAENYPIFINPTRNIGISTESDITIYGGAPNFMPGNMNPMVNAADDDGMNNNDITCNALRSYGGAADIGAVENTALPANGRVIYVRQGGSGDESGSSWANAMDDVQEAVDEAYRRMESEMESERRDTTERRSYTTYAQDGTPTTTKVDVHIIHMKVSAENLVQVWVAAGTYTKDIGYTIKNNVTVYGAFPKNGNPGMNERHPQLTSEIAQSSSGQQPKFADYETILKPSSVGHRVLTHGTECRPTDGDASNIPQDHVIYDNVRWDGFTLRDGHIYPMGGRNGGGGVNLYENITLSNCIVRDCEMSDRKGGDASKGIGRGGGIYCDGSVIENCYVYKNKMTNADHKEDERYGAGIYAISGTIYNTVISDNTLTAQIMERGGTTNGFPYGSGVFLELAEFYNNTIVNNSGGGAAIYCWNASAGSTGLTVYNSIVISGTEKAIDKEEKSTTIAHFYNCYLQSTQAINVEGSDNILRRGTANYNHPFAKSFDDATRDVDYRIGGTKVNSNGDICVNAGAETMTSDGTEAGAPITLPPYDMDYADRIQDCRVDIGAYEYNGAVDIEPDVVEASGTNGETTATYYVSQNGRGTRSANSKENAACKEKLQKVLDAAGRYRANEDNNSKRVIVKLAGGDFTYSPTRSAAVASAAGAEENPRTYSLMVPRGVEVWGGYSDGTGSSTSTSDLGFNDRKVIADATKTTLGGKYQADDQDVTVYHVVTFTENVYDEHGKITDKTLTGVPTEYRSVLDGLFIENGQATGEVDDYRYGGAARVPAYAHIRNCILQNNEATEGGGALYLEPNALVSGCLLQENTAKNGGAIYVAEPEASTVDKKAYVLTSTIVNNTAETTGGGIWFDTNLRANSVVLWQNTSSERANISGQTDPKSSDANFQQTINNYPLSYCAVENVRVPGVDNISVATSEDQGVRFDRDKDDYYYLKRYSMLARTGMPNAYYEKLSNETFPTLELKDYADVDRIKKENTFMEIGARAFDGPLVVTPNADYLMTRIFVAKTNTVKLEDAEALENSKDPYYTQEGSSFAYPMRLLGDALEYIRSARKITSINADKKAKFEIFLSTGDYVPFRDIVNEYSFSRGKTFLVPEGVSIIGGVDSKNYYCLETNEGIKKVGGVELIGKSTDGIIDLRTGYDYNKNNIIEPWELQLQTTLTGQVVNSDKCENVYHVITCMADANKVGELPTGDGANKGLPIIIDGVTISDSKALHYEASSVAKANTYYKGGGIYVDGNWNSTNAIIEDDSKGIRNIPLVVRKCSFTNNGAGYGGAIFSNGDVSVYGCNFAQNYAESGSEAGNGTYNGCGGAICANSKLTVVNSLFANNEARNGERVTATDGARGGAIQVGASGSLQMINCNVVRNKAKSYPAVYVGKPNSGYNGTTPPNTDHDNNPNQIVNSVLWGNESTNDNKVINYGNGEVLWFCAYEDGKGKVPVIDASDYRKTDYTVGEYIPYSLYKAAGTSAAAKVTNNITISSDNSATDGPNFINPSTEAGINGYMDNADWMVARINNLTDRGWTYVSDFNALAGNGIYYAISQSDEYPNKSMPIGETKYMSYGGTANTPMFRVSDDPSTTLSQTYIDIGVYEYPHVELKPEGGDETDILWVTEHEKTEAEADGSSWDKATSDFQRAIETLLASRNDHYKEIRLLEGTYQPVYTISGNLSFNINTQTQNGNVVYPEGKSGYKGVKALTIKGGYSKDVDGNYDVSQYVSTINPSPRTSEDRNHLVIIADAQQIKTDKKGSHLTQNEAIPITFDGITFSNTEANLNNGGAVYYKPQYKKSNPDGGGDATENLLDKPGTTTGWNTGMPKLTLSRCKFMTTGISATTPTVTIGEGGGEALVYNSLFHSNSGNPLEAIDTKVVNCTFALNKGHVVFKTNNQGTSALYNSLLWRNDETEVDGLAGDAMQYNAISGIEPDADNYNDKLSNTNNDLMEGPNFVNPLPEETVVAEQAKRDFSVNPSIKVTSQANVELYYNNVRLVKKNWAVDAINDAMIAALKNDSDIVFNARYYDNGLERGAYECTSALRRVLYMNPKLATSGNGWEWQTAYGINHLQTAIDAAAVYANTNKSGGKPTQAYVFAKGMEGSLNETLTMRDGVTLYGSINPLYNVQAEDESDDGKYTDEEVADYVNKVCASRQGMATTTNTTTVNGITSSMKTAKAKSRFDGLEIYNATSVAAPVVNLTEGGKLAITNSIIWGNSVTGGKPVVDLQAEALLYDVLLRDNTTTDNAPVVKLGKDARMLNCTVIATAGQKTVNDGARVLNSIEYVTGVDGSPFTPYLKAGNELYHATVPESKTSNSNLWYQLHEKSANIESGTADVASFLGNLHSFVNYDTDRDLLGNPRKINEKVDNGCYETWSTVGTTALSVNTADNSYGGNHYPHEGSVVYIQSGGILNCTAKQFTTENPLRPAYVLVRDGGSLYGNGNTLQLDYVAVERNQAGRYAMISVPFDVPSFDNVTTTTYDGSMVEAKADGYTPYYYDGKARSLWTYDYKQDDSKCWEEKTDAIKACEGFLFDRGDAATVAATYRFTACAADNNYVYTEDGDPKTVTLKQYDDKPSDGTAHFTSLENMGWNLVGIPYLVSEYNTSGNITENDYQMNIPHIVYTMDKDGKYASAQSWETDNTLKLTNAFFTQTAVADKIENVVFKQPVYTAPSGAKMHQMVAVSDEAGGTDCVEVRPSEEVSAAMTYQYGVDGLKMMALNDTLPQVYVSGTSGVRMSLVNAAPTERDIPLGIKAKRSGTYTVSLPERDAYAEYSAVWLTDKQTGTVTNLLTSDYTTAIATPGDYADRLTLRIGGIAPSAADGSHNGAYTVTVIDNIVTISGLQPGDNIAIYTSAGSLLTTATATTATFSHRIYDGIYVVRVNGFAKKVMAGR